MDLYLVSTNPQNTMLVSANGVAHYHISTTGPQNGTRTTSISRPAVSTNDDIIAEIEWKTHSTPTIIRSPLLSGAGQCVGMSGTGVQALSYLYKRNRFSSSRYFIGDDACEYQWKVNKGIGITLTRIDRNIPVAYSTWATVKEGFFSGEKRRVLQIQPCSIDIDLIILTFIIMETRLREKDGYVDNYHVIHDEEPQGDCGVPAEGDTDVGEIGEL